jgi:hypothetical protein
MCNEGGIDQIISARPALFRRHMSATPPADDYSKGMQTIARDHRRREGRGTARHRSGFHLKSWPGRDRHGRPRSTDRTQGGGRIFSREEIEDSADRVDRPETLRTIQRIIAEAGQLPR